jgi:tripartite-type tricarboxylate transporter receptor subunit TctC
VQMLLFGTTIMSRHTNSMALTLAWLMLIPAAAAADYPAKPVKIITQGAAGSGPDVITRIVAEHLGRRWHQQVLVLNHAGGGGVIAGRAAASADADGYTLYVPTITTFVIMPEIQRTLPFDLERDFARIGFIAETPMMVAVSPSLGVRTLPELVALAKRRPGELFYAANNRGSLPHLTAELLRARTGADLTFVPYQGAAAGLQDLMGGRISVIVESVGALSGAAQAGSIVPLATASAARLPNLPDLPTVAETVPGFTGMGWFVLMAPSGTPEAIVRKVNADLNAILADPQLRQRLQDLGAFVRTMSPAETGAFIRSEQEAWRPLVRQVGLTQ